MNHINSQSIKFLLYKIAPLFLAILFTASAYAESAREDNCLRADQIQKYFTKGNDFIASNPEMKWTLHWPATLTANHYNNLSDLKLVSVTLQAFKKSSYLSSATCEYNIGTNQPQYGNLTLRRSAHGQLYYRYFTNRLSKNSEAGYLLNSGYLEPTAKDSGGKDYEGWTFPANEKKEDDRTYSCTVTDKHKCQGFYFSNNEQEQSYWTNATVWCNSHTAAWRALGCGKDKMGAIRALANNIPDTLPCTFMQDEGCRQDNTKPKDEFCADLECTAEIAKMHVAIEDAVKYLNRGILSYMVCWYEKDAPTKNREWKTHSEKSAADADVCKVDDDGAAINGKNWPQPRKF